MICHFQSKELKVFREKAKTEAYECTPYSENLGQATISLHRSKWMFWFSDVLFHFETAMHQK